MNGSKLLFVILIVSCSFGCKKSTGPTQADIDQQVIQQYITSHQITNAQAEPYGLYYSPTVVGTGPFPDTSSTVTVSFKATLTDGTIIDSTTIPSRLSLTGAILGLKHGVPLMQPGGSAILLIPSAMAYGNESFPSIPANSVLIFNIQLISIP